MKSRINRSTVRIFGSLSALGKGSGDKLEQLLPFFDPILREFEGKEFQPDEIANRFNEVYGWKCTSDIVESFVEYFEKYDWIECSTQFSNTHVKKYIVNMPNSEELGNQQESINSKLHYFAQKFKGFIDSNPFSTDPNKDVDYYKNLLLKWLLISESFDPQNISNPTVDSSDDPTSMNDNDKKVYLWLDEHEKLLCARFVKHINKTNQNDIESLVKIASVALLTEVVQGFAQPLNPVKSTKLIVYLDTPVAMEYLNVSGKFANENISVIMSELKRIGAKIRIFSQSIEEMKRVLKATMYRDDPDGPTYSAIRRKEVLPSYVKSVIENPVGALQSKGVMEVNPKSISDKNNQKHFNKNVKEDLYARLDFIKNPVARDHDVDITALAMRQRKGVHRKDIFENKVIVLTRNPALASSVHMFCVNNNIINDKKIVGPIIHQKTMALNLWLRSMTKKDDFTIPKRDFYLLVKEFW